MSEAVAAHERPDLEVDALGRIWPDLAGSRKGRIWPDLEVDALGAVAVVIKGRE